MSGRYLASLLRTRRQQTINPRTGRTYTQEQLAAAVGTRTAFKDAGYEKVIGPHDLRHTSASHMALGGLLSESDAMKLYGWTDAGMWRRYTEQAREEAALEAHKRASPMDNLGRNR